MSRFFMWTPGIKFRSFCLQGRHLHAGAISLSHHGVSYGFPEIGLLPHILSLSVRVYVCVYESSSTILGASLCPEDLYTRSLTLVSATTLLCLSVPHSCLVCALSQAGIMPQPLLGHYMLWNDWEPPSTGFLGDDENHIVFITVLSELSGLLGSWMSPTHWLLNSYGVDEYAWPFSTFSSALNAFGQKT